MTATASSARSGAADARQADLAAMNAVAANFKLIPIRP
jgi:hypothetical protein